MKTIDIKILDPRMKDQLPAYATEGSAGAIRASSSLLATTKYAPNTANSAATASKREIFISGPGMITMVAEHSKCEVSVRQYSFIMGSEKRP